MTGLQPLTFLVRLAAVTPDLAPVRLWLDRLAFLVPGSTATRWLLLGDLVCLVALGRAAGWPLVGIPAALGVGFLVLTLLGMAVTNFYLGLAFFHLAVGVTAAVALRDVRWLGAALVVLTLLLGVLT